MAERAYISEIFVYPVKSTAGIALGEARVEHRGLAGDRRWAVTDASGDCLTAREFPRLLRIRARAGLSGLEMSAPGMPAIEVAAPAAAAPRLLVTVWNDRCEGLRAGTEAEDWLSRFLGLPCRLVHMDAACVRPVAGAAGEGEVSFADNAPLLVVSSASLVDLNRRLDSPMDMRRFRPNLVAAGTGAYAEDDWNRIRIGEAEFRAVERCDRCAVTTIDPDSAEKHPRQEPLRTLSQYRRAADGGVYFGRNFKPERLGRIRIGDAVTIVD